MSATQSRRQTGFTLIEVMIALLIGMATVLIMLQMLQNAESSKRTTTGGTDAQINGTMAIYSLERDIRASGYGINSFNILGCNLAYTPPGASTPVSLPIAPTTINPPASVIPLGDANTDTLLVMYGNSDGSSEGDPLIANSTAGSYQVSSPSSFVQGNYLVAQTSPRPATCNLSLDTVAAVNGSTVNVTPGVSGLPVDSIIFNLGSAPVIHAYAIRNGNLTMCDYMVNNCADSTVAAAATASSTVWVPIANDIVALRAEYGRDTSNPTGNMSGVVDTYDQTTPSAGTLPVYCYWARTMAMRLAVVSRSGAYDKSQPTSNANPIWSGSTVTTTSPANPTAIPLDLSGITSWQNYRYKTLETTVPLRNSIWQGGQTTYQGGSGGC